MKAAAQAQYERDIVRVKGAHMGLSEQLHAALCLPSAKSSDKVHAASHAVAEVSETVGLGSGIALGWVSRVCLHRCSLPRRGGEVA
jgi:hypothetical protein